MEIWDARIRRWIEELDRGLPPERAEIGTRPVLDAWYDGGLPACSLDRRALPEPWVGDPRAADLAAVILGLNPGVSLPAQLHPGGELVERVRRRGWSAVAAKWELPRETKAWWAERAAWPARLTGLPPVVESIVGMDLVPWHSVRFGRLLLHDRQVGPAAVQWLREEVFRRAVAIGARSRLSRLHPCERRRPVILALADGVRGALEHVGWSRLVRLDRTNGPSRYPTWPVDDRGEREDRTFTVLLQPEAPWTVALVSDSGDDSLAPPGPAFDGLVLRLLREHGCPCAAAHLVTRAG
ncbi:hypothetical protein [Vulgatibacter sp.]|uniref:hypothetical protein n=1 Tax=Vulgatibacter sp. TaxID=1971226 RepID=UPI003569DAF0